MYFKNTRLGLVIHDSNNMWKTLAQCCRVSDYRSKDVGWTMSRLKHFNRPNHFYLDQLELLTLVFGFEHPN